jgi:hypothetical protein
MKKGFNVFGRNLTNFNGLSTSLSVFSTLREPNWRTTAIVTDTLLDNELSQRDVFAFFGRYSGAIKPLLVP